MTMEKRKAIKVNPYDNEPIVLSQRVNYKMVDPTTVNSEHLTFGMVVAMYIGSLHIQGSISNILQRKTSFSIQGVVSFLYFRN